MTVWQISAGEGERDYHELFLDFGLACVGPGDPGDYFEHQAEYADKDNPAVFRPFMRRFCEEVEPGDLLALKRAAGRAWEVLAVGQLESGYEYEERLGDVEGWDLQHTHRVAWRRPAKPRSTVSMLGFRPGWAVK